MPTATKKRPHKPKRNQPWPEGRPVPPGWKRTRKGTVRKRSLTWRFRRVLLLVALFAVVAASGGSFVIWNTTELPKKDPPLPETTFVCAADVTSNCNQDNSIAQLSGSNDRVLVTYDQIPSIFIQALVSAEDKEFFRHEGVDPNGVARALVANLRNDSVQQGGSTITQQYVKNVYLSNERTWERKIKEAILAIKLDRELPKQEILERYLNTIYFGRGAYGIEAASRIYFGKHVESLGLQESAYLAGLIREPEGIDAQRLPGDPQRDEQQKGATVRRTQVLDTMQSEGYITPEARDAVKAEGWDYVLPRPVSSTNFGKVAHPELGTEYFLDYVHHWLVSSGQFTDSQVYGGGLRVYTTLDFSAQAAAYDSIRSTLDRPNDPSASIVALDDKGRVRAMVGGFDYNASKVNLAVGQDGGGSGRQPGSSFKPLILAQYLADGQSLGQVYDAPAKKIFDLPGERWTVANYGDAEQGQLNVVEATKKSSNTAYAQIMQDVIKTRGIDNIVATAERMGITGDLPKVPSLVLGTGSVSVLDMASAYSTFADEGEHIGPYVVTKVTNSSGQVLWEAPFNRERVLPKEVAATVGYVLNQVVEQGTGTGARFGQSLAGKTGTTENYRDAWFVGYTCKMTAAVWVGYPTPDDQGRTKYMQGVHGINVAGGTLPSTIFSKFMKRAAAGLQSCPFPLPPETNFNPGSYAPGTAAAGTTPVSSAPGTTAEAPVVSSTTSSTTPASSSTTASTAPATTTTSAVAPSSSTTAPTLPPTSTTQPVTVPPTTPAPIAPP